MRDNRAYRTELDPNNVQRTALLKHAGTARFAYNWGSLDGRRNMKRLENPRTQSRYIGS